jgi:uncharacterized membrane protein YjgN (DUF898 family)
MANNKLLFHGRGFEFFGTLIINFLLTLITLGIYYPWARARTLQCLYGETEFAGDRFNFQGTGKEMFIGFVKAVGIILLLIVLFYLCLSSGFYWLGFIIYTGGLICIIPLAIHGGIKYRLSRTSWRNIRFGYRGILKDLFLKFFIGFFLSIITLGVYGSWFIIDLRSYIINNIRFGNVKFSYSGKGLEYFILCIKGIFLSLITLGIYSFWFSKDIFNYLINNILLEQDGKLIKLNSKVTAGGMFKLFIINFIIVVFTLGIGFPWVLARSLRYIFSNIEFPDEFNPDAIVQSEENYYGATGSFLLNFLDINIF